MLIIREIFTAKPGQASKLAKLFKKVFGKDVQVMTDVVGEYNTVVLERKINNLTEFEKEMEDYRVGKRNPNMTPDMSKEMSGYTEMYLKGRREIYRVEE